MTDQQHLIDDSSPVKYFSQSPHIDHDDCDPDMFYLLHHYRKVIGLNNGQPCDETIAETMARVGWGEAKTREVRARLVDKGLIRLDAQDGFPSVVTLINRWRENFERYDTRIENRYPYQKPIRGLGENRYGSEEKKTPKELNKLNTIPTPDKSGSVSSSENKPKGRGTSKSQKPSVAKTGRSKADLDSMYESIMLHLFKIAPHETERRRAQGSMVGLFRKSLLEIAPDISPRRVELFCIDLGTKSDFMHNLKDRSKFQAYYGDFVAAHPPRTWVEGKVRDDPEYRSLKRPPFRKFENGKWWMRQNMIESEAVNPWLEDPNPIID